MRVFSPHADCEGTSSSIQVNIVLSQFTEGGNEAQKVCVTYTGPQKKPVVEWGNES